MRCAPPRRVRGCATSRASDRSSRPRCCRRWKPAWELAPAQRVLLHRALNIGDALVDALRAHPAAVRVELAGSARRQADSVKDLDIIATATDPGALVRSLGELDLIESASAPNENAARGRTHTGLPVDLRVVSPDNFGNLLQHFTGSAAHNVALREAAVRRGLHVSEYGILDDETGETLRCATEEAVYERLGLTYPEPELRENRGELSPQFVAPQLVTRRRPARRPAHAHARLRRARHDRGHGARGASPAAMSTSRSPTTRRRTASATTSRPTSSSARSSASPRPTRRSTASRSSSGPRRTSCPTARPTTTTSCSRGWTG